MKEILVKDLQKGDVYYYEDRYEIVVSNLLPGKIGPKVKVITGPSNIYKMGYWYYLPIVEEVLLLVRDGVEV